MPRLLTGIDWLDNLRLHPSMPLREPCNLTVNVDGEERDETFHSRQLVEKARRQVTDEGMPTGTEPPS